MKHRTAHCPGRGVGRLILAVFIGILVGGPGTAVAQEDADLIRVAIDSFGVGGVYRPGTITPVHLTVQYAGTAPVNAFVSIDLSDSDGDIEMLGRRLTLNQGFPNSVWLYLPISYQFDKNKPLDIRVHEMDEEDLGREIFVDRINPTSRNPVDPTFSLIGVIGTGDGNLYRYGRGTQAQYGNRKPTMSHESTVVLAGLKVTDLPDRWYGFDMFETLVWFGGSGADPSAIRADVGRALSDWVHRGGHLVIGLPEASDLWVGTQLDRVIPHVQWELMEGVPLIDADAETRDILGVMSRKRGVGESMMIPRFNIHRFHPVGETWEESGAIPFLDIERRLENGGIERWPVVVQQIFGHGRVTMIGLPVTDPRLARAGLSLPEPDIFWNQILGRRQDTPSAAEVSDVVTQKQLVTDRPDLRSISSELPKLISLTTQAVGGLLLALILFAVYWVVSGPAAFAFLKHRGWSHQNWLVFVMIAGVFTLVSWLGAQALRSNDIKPRHITVLDHVAGYEFDRAHAFITTVLPGYGRQKIQIGADDQDRGTPGEFDLLYAFRSPLRDDERSEFPDQRRYDIDAGRQTTIDMPARHTAKSLTVRWVGPTQPGWGMPIPADSTRWPFIDATGRLRGRIQHALPAGLQKVLIVYVSNTYNPRRIRNSGINGGEARLSTYGWKLSDLEWEPGEVLDFSAPSFDYSASSRFFTTNGALDSLFKRARGTSTNLGFDNQSLGAVGTEGLVQLLSFYQQLRPPIWQALKGAAPRDHVCFTRSLGRELDLSPWLNRPCLIIIGSIPKSPVPVPIEVGGTRLEESDEDSTTIVRWIYPLATEEAPNER